MAQSRGFTLVETMLAGGLLLLLGALSALFLSGTGRRSAKINARASLQSEGALCLKWLQTDLLKVRAAHCVWDETAPGGPILGMIKTDSADASGAPVYEQHLTLYALNTDQRLFWRKVCPPEPPELELEFEPANPPFFDFSHLRAANGQRNGGEKTLSARANTFAVTVAGRVMTVDLELEQTAGPNRTETMRFSRSWSFRL